MALRILLALMGGLLALASRTRASVRQAITRDLVVEIASDDGVAHHYVFLDRRVWSRAGKAPAPDCALRFATAAQGARALTSRHTVTHLVAGLLEGTVSIRGGTARAPHRCARSRASTSARRRTASPYTPTSRPPGARPTRGSRTSLSGGTRPSGRRSTG